MERLTKYDNGRYVIEPGVRMLYEALTKLGKYEDMGVSPEQLREIDVMFSDMAKELAEYKEKCPKMNIYRAGYFPPQLEVWFEEVEKALGFKLFIWQKTYIDNGVFRRYGETTARILRDLSLIDAPPINLIEFKKRGRKERIYCEDLIKIKTKLDAAGVPTRRVLQHENDRYRMVKGIKHVQYSREGRIFSDK